MGIGLFSPLHLYYAMNGAARSGVSSPCLSVFCA